MSDETLRELIRNLPAILAGLVALVTLFRVAKVQTDVRKIELATNSMKDALVAATDSAARAEGALKGTADEQARVAAAGVPLVPVEVKVINESASPVPTKTVKGGPR